MTTLKQVLKLVNLFQEKHLQLNDFRFGDVTELLSNGDIKYPALFCDINPTKIDKVNMETVFNLSFWAADLSNVSGGTKLNEIDVLSDLTQVCQDLITMLDDYLYQDEFEVKDISDIEYLINGNEDCAILAKFNISISVDYILNPCGIPTIDAIDKFNYKLPINLD